LLVVIGDLVQQGVTQSDYSLTPNLNFRIRRLRPLLEGEPVVLIERSRIIDRNLRREQVTREELTAEARQQQIASLQRVDWAVLETNGRISFIEST